MIFNTSNKLPAYLPLFLPRAANGNLEFLAVTILESDLCEAPHSVQLWGNAPDINVGGSGEGGADRTVLVYIRSTIRNAMNLDQTTTCHHL